eukprot:CAMPEP_0118905468 /NCGR_PEP_ID=MMETSP1166-20130328/9463_1 /TAXON_ID=1104430 /ORGANISM="Chrysoreinhardia sp, Strain CCMP3193" /LENGTH=978 /DNA_ID=CAMNT_0006844739 /DNA_START=101 /DNA_END=3037 /DNA_ORIENTATION=+
MTERTKAHWQEGAECMVCEAALHPLLPGLRHHCRKCGALVCSRCSARCLPARDDVTEVRCCDACWTAYHDSLVAMDRRLSSLETRRRLRLRLERESSATDDPHLVRVFGVDGRSTTLPIDEGTTARDLAGAATKTLLLGAPGCGLWTARGDLDRLDAVDNRDTIVDVLSRWRVRGLEDTAKLVVPLGKTRGSHDDDDDDEDEDDEDDDDDDDDDERSTVPTTENFSRRREEENGRGGGVGVGVGVVVRRAGWLRRSPFTTTMPSESEARRFAVVAGGGIGLFVECETTARLLPGDVVDVAEVTKVADLDDCKSVAVGREADCFVLVLGGGETRLEFAAPGGVEAAKLWRDEIDRYSSGGRRRRRRRRRQRGGKVDDDDDDDVVAEGREIQDAEDLLEAATTQRSRFDAVGLEVDAATRAMASCHADLDVGLFGAALPPPKKVSPSSGDRRDSIASLAAAVFGACESRRAAVEGVCDDDARVASARGDAAVAARALGQACADAAARARRFADAADRAANRLANRLARLEDDDRNDRNDQRDSAFVSDEDDDDDGSEEEDIMARTAMVSLDSEPERTSCSSETWALLRATTSKGHDDDESPRQQPYDFREGLEVDLTTVTKAPSLLEGLEPVARLEETPTTTTTIAAHVGGPWKGPGGDDSSRSSCSRSPGNDPKATTHYYEIKTTLKHEAARLGLARRLVAERAALAEVRESSFCASLVAAFQDRNFCYVVLDYVDGGSLAGPLAEEEGATFHVGALAVALEHCRLRGVVHRDVRLANVRLDRRGYCVLSNFDHAATLGTAAKLTSWSSSQDVFPAPECVDGRGYDWGVDWHALGCLAFDLLRGVPVFTDDAGLYNAIRDAANGRTLPHALRDDDERIKNFKGDTDQSPFAVFVASLLAARDRRPCALDDVKGSPFLGALDWPALEARDPRLAPARRPPTKDNALHSAAAKVREVTPRAGFFGGRVVCFTGDHRLFAGF